MTQHNTPDALLQASSTQNKPSIDIKWPSKLYDRETQVGALQNAYHRNQRSPALILITGASGGGKSALAWSLKPRVQEDGGWFLVGKSDKELQQPHGPFLSMAKHLIQQLENSPKELKHKVRDAILQAVESECGLLAQAIPTLRTILQDEEAETQLEDEKSPDSSSSENSFHVGVSMSNEKPVQFLSVFCRFLQAVAAVQPLCLLLDDLQWIDNQSLDILAALMDQLCSISNHNSRSNTNNLAVVGTCRGNEVGTFDHLAIKLRQMEEKGVQITDIQVHNLHVEALTSLIADALQMSPSDVLSLAQVVHCQTKGNVFFAKQYLKRLVEEGVLYRDESNARDKDSTNNWIWNDAALVLALPPADNKDLIVQLLSRKIQQFPIHVVETLKTIACMGSTFTETILCHAGTVVSSQVLLALEVASTQGFIVHDVDSGSGYFVHDKFREAALSLIQAQDKPRYHLSIGRNLRKQLSIPEVKEHVILIVEQLKHGLDLVTDPDERDDFARLFLKASKEASKKSAFVAAANYVDYGISMLNKRHWRDQYNLSIELYSTGAELGYCIGDYVNVDKLAAQVSQHGRSVGDKNRALITQLMCHSGTGCSKEGIAMCQKALKELKVPFPQNPGPTGVTVELLQMKRAIGNQTEEDILALPPLLDPRVISAMKVLLVMWRLYVTAQAPGAPLAAFRLVRLSLKHGLCPLAALGFHLYGLYLITSGNIEDAALYGQLSCKLLQQYPCKQLEGFIKFQHWSIIEASKSSYRSILDPMWNSGSLSWETGDMDAALACGIIHSSIRIFICDPISDIVKAFSRHERLCNTYKQLKNRIVSRASLQVCQNLQGETLDPLVLTGSFMNENELLQELLQKGEMKLQLAFLLHYKYMLAVLMNENEAAHRFYQQHRTNFKGFIFPYLPVYQSFLGGLVAASLARQTSGWAQKQRYSEAKRQCTKLKNLLVHCPDNVVNKMYLVDAELEFCRGRHSSALLKYERAISAADLQGFVSDQAIACEKAGRMLQHTKRNVEAAHYLEKARLLFLEWGVQVKVEQMDELLAEMC